MQLNEYNNISGQINGPDASNLKKGQFSIKHSDPRRVNNVYD